ncbi:MAG: type II toxin-antitoxin system VapC family toxin [Rhodocyclales bacterium]|nr:type II toxin-antitoxin system VapC family toxin [Rhodocyclales bacterium]
MRLLLDTHVALWLLYEPRRLPAALARSLAAGDFQVFVSMVSVWEVAIKHSIRRPDGSPKLGCSAADFLSGVSAAGCELLPLAPAHCLHADALPYRTNPASGKLHGDPFDRMLAAQAVAEPVRLVTADPLLALHAADAPGLIEKI